VLTLRKRLQRENWERNERRSYKRFEEVRRSDTPLNCKVCKRKHWNSRKKAPGQWHPGKHLERKRVGVE